MYRLSILYFFGEGGVGVLGGGTSLYHPPTPNPPDRTLLPGRCRIFHKFPVTINAQMYFIVAAFFDDAASVQDRTCADGDIRLSGGSNRREGLVEICINNRWGTICGDNKSGWDKYEAEVVCAQLGYDLAENSKAIILTI